MRHYTAQFYFFPYVRNSCLKCLKLRLWNLIQHVSIVCRSVSEYLRVLYCNRRETVLFAYVAILRVDGKQVDILCKQKTLSI